MRELRYRNAFFSDYLREAFVNFCAGSASKIANKKKELCQFS